MLKVPRVSIRVWVNPNPNSDPDPDPDLDPDPNPDPNPDPDPDPDSPGPVRTWTRIRTLTLTLTQTITLAWPYPCYIMGSFSTPLAEASESIMTNCWVSVWVFDSVWVMGMGQICLFPLKRGVTRNTELVIASCL